METRREPVLNRKTLYLMAVAAVAFTIYFAYSSANRSALTEALPIIEGEGAGPKATSGDSLLEGRIDIVADNVNELILTDLDGRTITLGVTRDTSRAHAGSSLRQGNTVILGLQRDTLDMTQLGKGDSVMVSAAPAGSLRMQALVVRVLKRGAASPPAPKRRRR